MNPFTSPDPTVVFPLLKDIYSGLLPIPTTRIGLFFQKFRVSGCRITTLSPIEYFWPDANAESRKHSPLFWGSSSFCYAQVIDFFIQGFHMEYFLRICFSTDHICRICPFHCISLRQFFKRCISSSVSPMVPTTFRSISFDSL